MNQGMRAEAHRSWEPLQPCVFLLPKPRADHRAEDGSPPPARQWGRGTGTGNSQGVRKIQEQEAGRSPVSTREAWTDSVRWLKAWSCLWSKASGQSCQCSSPKRWVWSVGLREGRRGWGPAQPWGAWGVGCGWGSWQTGGRKLEAGEGSFPVLRITPITTTAEDGPGLTGRPASASQVLSFKPTDLEGQRENLPFPGLQLVQTYQLPPLHGII